MNSPEFDGIDPAALSGTVAGRLAVLLRAAENKTEVTSDDAVLEDELNTRRLGDPNKVGPSVRLAVELGALVPKLNPDGEQASKKSDRKFRKRTLIGVFCTTPKVPVILAKMRRILLNNFPKRSRDLFSDLED
jgi:hypothetical protein